MRGTRRVLPTLVGLFVALGATPLGTPQAAVAASTELFFSEYIEGSSNNKALEIYNDTGASIDLGADGYSVQMAYNGNPTPGLTINLTGTVAAGDVYVLAHSSANATILAQADQTNGSGWFNGDDAVILRKGTAHIDVIGQIGVDPGTEWGSGLTSTADNTLRRKAGISAGDVDGGDAFDPSVEWDGYAQDTFDGLGAHGADAAPTVDVTSPADGATGVPVGSDITITFSEPVNVDGSWFTISCGVTGAHEASVTGGPTTFTLDPAADFAETETCTVTVVAAQVADQDGIDPPNNMSADDAFSFSIEGDLCSTAFTPIYEIQGSGSSAAVTGNVTTQGVIVGDFEGPTSSGVQGFFLQDATGDGDADTSDGIFVYTGNADNGLTAGQVVRVSGYARERFNLTTLNGSNSNFSAVTQITDCGTSATISPADVTLPFASLGEPERYEGMLVRFPQPLVISEYFNYERFGEIVLALPLDGETRPFTPTSVEEPGAAAIARAAANRLSRITLDDGLGAQNPPIVRHPNGDPFSLANRFRGGDTVADTVGVLTFDFNLYRIQPTAPADYTAVNPRPGAPEPVGGRLKVGAMNMLNFFITGDYRTGDPNDNKCGPAQDTECRGHDADQPDEFSRQRDKLIAALAGLGAEVIGLNEIENTLGVDPLGDPDGIVAGLNDLLGAGTFAHIDTGVIGSDVIRVGLIYKPAKVTPVGAYQVLDSTVDARFNDDKSRPVLAQTFRENATGALFTVAVNHLKSKGSNCNALGDPDVGDGQGNCNETRTLAAQALVDWLATDPTGSGDPDFLITGDLNAYAMEDPIDAVRAGADDVHGTGDDFTNLIARFGGRYAYSYVFDGQFGYLDHALASTSLDQQVTGATAWHINADESDLLDYDTSFKPPAQDAIYEPNAYRSSDHDPVVVGLDLVPAAGKLTGAGTWADGSFSIEAQFQKDATSPSGNTALGLSGGQSFASTGYDWLVVAGGQADLQGTGTLDGTPGYGFLLSVIDGGSPSADDRIRVVVWDADGTVVYDSQPGDARTAAPTGQLTSGNVTIHKTK